MQEKWGAVEFDDYLQEDPQCCLICEYNKDLVTFSKDVVKVRNLDTFKSWEIRNTFESEEYLAFVVTEGKELVVARNENGINIINIAQDRNSIITSIVEMTKLSISGNIAEFQAVFTLDASFLAFFSPKPDSEELFQSIYMQEEMDDRGNGSNNWIKWNDFGKSPERNGLSTTLVSSFETGFYIVNLKEPNSYYCPERFVQIVIWDVKSNPKLWTTLIVPVDPWEFEWKICLSPDAKFAAVTTDVNIVSVLESSKKILLYEFEFEDGVSSLCLSNTDRDTLLSTGFQSGLLVINSLLSGSRVHALNFQAPVKCINVSASGNFVASIIGNHFGKKTTVVHNLGLYEQVFQFESLTGDEEQDSESCTSCVACSKMFLVNGERNRLYFRDLVTGNIKTVKTFPEISNGIVFEMKTEEYADWHINSLSFSLDSRYLASGHANNMTLVIDTLTMKVIAKFESDFEDRAENNSLRGIRSVCISSDGKVASGGTDQRVSVRSISTGRTLNVFKHNGPINVVCFSLDSKYLASGGDDTRVFLRNLSKRESIVLKHDAAVLTACFCPYNEYLASGAENGVVYVWSILSGEPKFEFLPQSIGRRFPVLTVAIGKSRVGDLILASGGEDKKTTFRSLETGTILYSFCHSDSVRSSCFFECADILSQTTKLVHASCEIGRLTVRNLSRLTESGLSLGSFQEMVNKFDTDDMNNCPIKLSRTFLPNLSYQFQQHDGSSLLRWLWNEFLYEPKKLSTFIESVLEYFPAAVLEPNRLQKCLDFDLEVEYESSIFAQAIEHKKIELLSQLFSAVEKLVPPMDEADTNTLIQVRTIQVLNEASLRCVAKAIGKVIKAGFGAIAVDAVRNLRLVNFNKSRLISIREDQNHNISENQARMSQLSRLGAWAKISFENLTVNKNAICIAKETLYSDPTHSVPIYGSEWLEHSVLLPGLFDFENMRNFVNGPLELFDNPNMRAGITALWVQVSHRFFFNAIVYTVLICLFTFFTSVSVARGASMSSTFSELGYNASSHPDLPSRRTQIASFVCGSLSCILYLYFLCLEFIQFYRGYNYLDDFWNMIQLSGFCFGITSFILFLCDSDPIVLRIICSFSVLLLWVNALFFLKPFKQWGFFVELLEAIIGTIISFLAVCFILLVGITGFFHILIGPDETKGPFDQYETALLCAFKMAMLNSFDDSLLESEVNSLTVLAYMVWAWVIFIFLLCIMNALIALMNSTYECVTEKRVPLRFYLP